MLIDYSEVVRNPDVLLDSDPQPGRYIDILIRIQVVGRGTHVVDFQGSAWTMFKGNTPTFSDPRPGDTLRSFVERCVKSNRFLEYVAQTKGVKLIGLDVKIKYKKIIDYGP